jgi:hypothetical protein
MPISKSTAQSGGQSGRRCRSLATPSGGEVVMMGGWLSCPFVPAVARLDALFHPFVGQGQYGRLRRSRRRRGAPAATTFFCMPIAQTRARTRAVRWHNHRSSGHLCVLMLTISSV